MYRSTLGFLGQKASNPNNRSHRKIHPPTFKLPEDMRRSRPSSIKHAAHILMPMSAYLLSLYHQKDKPREKLGQRSRRLISSRRWECPERSGSELPEENSCDQLPAKHSLFFTTTIQAAAALVKQQQQRDSAGTKKNSQQFRSKPVSGDTLYFIRNNFPLFTLKFLNVANAIFVLKLINLLAQFGSLFFFF